MFRFEKLDVWRKAVEFADQVYELTALFPDTERFGLTSQMRRATVSISSNIAEGSGRPSDKDFAHFVAVAYGSLMEVVSQAEIAVRRGFLDHAKREAIYTNAEELARMLSGLKRSLLRARTPEPRRSDS
jgi:four helix bundle protein